MEGIYKWNIIITGSLTLNSHNSKFNYERRMKCNVCTVEPQSYEHLGKCKPEMFIALKSINCMTNLRA